MSKNKAGRSGAFFESKKESREFEDRQGNYRRRRKTGEFGVDESFKQGEGKNFISHEFALGVGEYEFGKAKIELSKSGFTFSAEAEGPKTTIEINKNFSELTKDAGFDSSLINSLRDTVVKSRLNLDINNIKLKNIEFGSIGGGIGANFTTEKLGAKATGQLASITVTLETPLGDISAKLKAGISFGNEIGLAKTKAGKIGFLRNQKIGFGMWEFALSPTQQAEQKPSFFEWGVYAATPEQYQFSTIPSEIVDSIFQSNPVCKFDFNELSKQQSTPIDIDSAQTSPAINWDDDNSSPDRKPQGSFVSNASADNAPKLTTIPTTANLEKAKKIFQDNLVNLDLDKEVVAKETSHLSIDEVKKANQELLKLSERQAEILKTLKEEKSQKAKKEALERLAQGAEGLKQFGNAINCRALVVIGSVIEFGKKVVDTVEAIGKIAEDANALGDIFGPLAGLAPLGPLGMALGAFSILLNLMSGPTGPDPTEVMIGKLDELLRGQQEILNLLDTVRSEQAIMLRTIKQDIESLKIDLQERLTSVRIDFTEAFEKIETSIAFLTEFSRLAARNQYLQTFKHYCSQTQVLSLRQGREADTATLGLQNILLTDAANEVLTGFMESRASLSSSDQLQILSKIFLANLPEEAIDQHLNFLLGYIYEMPTLNPLIWQQAAQHYISHTTRFFGLYMEDSDNALREIIALGESTDEDWKLEQTPEKQQAIIDEYYQALNKVKLCQNGLMQQFNTVRRQQYNSEHSKEALGQGVINQINFFDLPQNLINKFNSFAEDHQKYDHSIKHLRTKQVGSTPGSLLVTFNAYASKEHDAQSARSFDISLHYLADKLREKPAENSSGRDVFDLLLCAEYLGTISLDIEARNMKYPEIPLKKERHHLHANDIVNANDKGEACPGRLYFAEENSPWTLEVNINYEDRSCDLILSSTLPRQDELETLLKESTSGYLLTNYQGNERIFYLSKYPRQFVQIFGATADFIAKLRRETISGATRRALAGEDIAKLASLEARKSMLEVSFSGDYNDFNTSITGIEEYDGGYHEPKVEENSFHRKIRAAIPKFIEQNLRAKKAKIIFADGEADKLREKIKGKFIEERKLFLQYVLSKKADTPQLQIALQEYHQALNNLDLAICQLQAHFHLAGKKLNSSLLTANTILEEMHQHHADILQADLTPSLSKACSLAEDQRIKPSDVSENTNLSRYHPKRLLQGTIAQFRIHKSWRDWMRKSYPWLKYKDVQQYWTLKIYSSIGELHEQLYAQYKDLKQDINGLTQAKARLQYAHSTPITTSTDFQQVYNTVHDWALVHAKNSLVTGYLGTLVKQSSIEDDLNYTKLKRGWADNIGFLLQYASGMLDIKIESANLVNFNFWYDGAVHFCKLLDDEIGPYKNVRSLSTGSRLTIDMQVNAINDLRSAGNELNKAITAVAFSEKLFNHVFNRYIQILDAISILINQSVNETDFDIVQSLLADNFSEARLNAGTFLNIKDQLNVAAILLKNYLELGFADNFSDLFSKTIFDGHEIEKMLRKVLESPTAKEKAKDRSSLKLVTQLKAKAEFIKEEVLDVICLNRSLSYFAHRLSNYFSNKELHNTDTLYITADFMLQGSAAQNKVKFASAHLDLVDQFLNQNRQIKALNICGIFLDDEVLKETVSLLKEVYPHITKVTLAAVNLTTLKLAWLMPLLPQLKHLDLRGNSLGSLDESINSQRFTHLLNFLEKAVLQVSYLGLANCNLSASDIGAIQAALFMSHEADTINLALDLTGNDVSETENFSGVTFINDVASSAEKMKFDNVAKRPPLLSLTPELESYGQPQLGQALTLLTRTEKVLRKAKPFLSTTPNIEAESTTRPSMS